MADPRNDPYRSYNFSVEIDQIPRAAFSDASGLTGDGEATDYREGTDLQQNARKLVGLRKYTAIVLKRGYTRDDSLWKWHANILNGQPDRRNVTIVPMNERSSRHPCQK